MKVILLLILFTSSILLSSCANQKNISANVNQVEQTIQQLTIKNITQEKNETGEFLLIQEEKDLISPFYKYWILDLIANKVVKSGSISKGEILWHDTYQIKVIRHPEVMNLNDPSNSKIEIIDLKKVKQ